MYLTVFTVMDPAGAAQRAPSEGERPTPVKVHVFAAQTSAPAGGADGTAESVSDFQKAIAEKLAKTMTLVPTRHEADIAIEVQKRERGLMLREVWIRVHHRGGEPTSLHRSSTQGGFADIAEGTMRLIDGWAQQYYKPVVGLEPPDALREMPPDIHFDINELRIKNSAIRANAAVRLGARGARGRIAGANLLELLGDNDVVTSDRRIVRPIEDHRKLMRVGVVAGIALARIGMIDEVFRALASDPREGARQNAAEALGKVPGERSVAALQAALRNDTSDRVRKAADRALKEVNQRP